MRHTKTAEWMVQVWEGGDWVDYWPVTARPSRRDAVKRAPRVLCGTWRQRYDAGTLRWRVGRKIRDN